jgi:hypothetical protein
MIDILPLSMLVLGAGILVAPSIGFLLHLFRNF